MQLEIFQKRATELTEEQNQQRCHRSKMKNIIYRFVEIIHITSGTLKMSSVFAMTDPEFWYEYSKVHLISNYKLRKEHGMFFDL